MSTTVIGSLLFFPSVSLAQHCSIVNPTGSFVAELPPTHTITHRHQRNTVPRQTSTTNKYTNTQFGTWGICIHATTFSQPLSTLASTTTVTSHACNTHTQTHMHTHSHNLGPTVDSWLCACCSLGNNEFSKLNFRPWESLEVN